MRFWFIATEKACYPVALLCRVLQVSPSRYDAWHKRPAATCSRQDQSLVLEVAAIHAESPAAMAVRGCRWSCTNADSVSRASQWRG